MELSRRINLRLSDEQHAAVSAFARARGLRPSPATRLLLAQALSPAARDRDDESVALAALLAAEHAVLMVAAVLPDGQRRMRELAPEAAAAAEERLSLFREAER